MQTSPLWPLVPYATVLIVLIVAVLLAPLLLGERHQRGSAADEPFESGIDGIGDARLPLAARFHLIAMLFVIFGAEALFALVRAPARERRAPRRVDSRQCPSATMGRICVFPTARTSIPT